ncbi:metal ABC transporter ATP-binding protein [Breznakiella homolactica]|uniref:ABC transporter ATP-binding protein n=1 Tax=Breznakiella homolactica TaxID=2798577 RepID=A0A7T7XN58_9SPIR|nr:ABC transporter ATP-binding protein [Breznakiella homolactica]QQO09322.1 ABC transporter ATP-binding protein [Breznakiella homolactica]
MKPFHPVDRDITLYFDDVSFSYGAVAVLRHAGFHIHQGEFVALVGPNGSGKTTILKLILGLEEPQAGRIELLGASPRSSRNRIGYVPQQAGYDQAFPISVREVVKMGRLRPLSRKFTAEDSRAVDEALAQVEITDLAARPYTALSGGQRRRVLVARALAASPNFLLLDEPTANMDEESEERLFKTLGRLKGSTTILIVTHDTAFVSSLTDRVLCLGSRENPGNPYGVVQHKTHPESLGAEADSPGNYRINHNSSIPGNSCYEEEGGK